MPEFMSYTRPLLLAATLLSLPLPATAEDWLVISGYSYHFENRDEYRADNPGAGWERPSEEYPLSWMAGYYRNSYDRDTFYAGARWEPELVKWEHVKLGVFVGLASGYWTPVVALPMASFQWGRFGFNLVGAPSIREYSGYIGGQVKFKFD